MKREGKVEELQARLVVGADGRNSLVRQRAGFPMQQDPERLLVTGVLLEELYAAPQDVNHFIVNSTLGQSVPWVPQGNGRVRVYLVHTKATSARLQGKADFPRFVVESIRCGVPAEWYAGAKVAGLLATFDGADT